MEEQVECFLEVLDGARLPEEDDECQGEEVHQDGKCDGGGTIERDAGKLKELLKEQIGRIDSID